MCYWSFRYFGEVPFTLVFDFFLLPGVLWAHNKMTCPILGLVSLENLLSKAITLRIWEMSFHRFFRYLFSVHINLHKGSPGVPRASVIANVLCEYSNMNFLREVFNFHPRFCSAFCLALLSDLGFKFWNEMINNWTLSYQENTTVFNELQKRKCCRFNRSQNLQNLMSWLPFW